MEQTIEPPWWLEPVVSFAVLALMLLAASWLLRLIRWLLLPGRSPPGRSEPLPGTLLDTVLYFWNAHDCLTMKGLLDGGIVIFGRPGSGKSSSSSFQLLKSVVAYPKSGGLILSASPGDLALCRRIFASQPDRLIVFDESSGHRFNWLSYVLERGGSTKDLMQAITAISETVTRGGGQASGEESSFFAIGAKRIIENALVITKHACGCINPSDLMTFINGAANSVEEVHSDKFKKTLHWRFLKSAYEADKPQYEEYDVEQAREFFTKELPRMADRTRSSLIAVVMNTLHMFNSGVNRLLFSTDTNISPKRMDEGKWLFINQPISRCGQEGAFSLGVWKFMTQWHVMRRDTNIDNPPCIIHVDELHRTLNSYDSLFLGECRKFGGCMIACSQSKASFYAAMGGEASEAQVDALLNNFSHKIIHALGDIKTAEWASSLVGNTMQLNIGGSEQIPESLLSAWIGQGVWSGSMNEQMRPLMEARQFMHNLRTGGANNDFLCDAVVIRSGEPFASNGQCVIWAVFSQK